MLGYARSGEGLDKAGDLVEYAEAADRETRRTALQTMWGWFADTAHSSPGR